MKVVILAGGLGTRLSEETIEKPKPMVEIGGKPILWHIMKIYSFFGFNEFIICCGYKGYIIKEYFNNYFLHQSDVTFDLIDNKTTYLQKRAEPWKITLVDTGLNTMTGGRIKRLKNFFKKNETFMMTYGDGLSSINIDKLLKFHLSHKGQVTLTSIIPPGRFGEIKFKNKNQITRFIEKPKNDKVRVNGGFFVINSNVLNLINDDSTVWENEPLQTLAKSKKLFAYNFDGFWQPMDTLRDKTYLEGLWLNNNAPWKIWKDE